MIIFTGMDNTGKTTLIEKVSERTALPIVKSMGPKATIHEKNGWLLDQMTREKVIPGSVLFDRFLPFEEMVYGKVLRDGPLYHLDDPYMKSLKDLDPIIVYTRPPQDRIFNFGERPQMEGVVETSKELLAEWDNLMWKLIAEGWEIIVYDYTTDDPEGHSLFWRRFEKAIRSRA